MDAGIPKSTWKGYYFDGQSAQRQSVSVQVTLVGLQLTRADGSRIWWPYEELRQTQGANAGEQVRLERGGELGEALVIREPGFLAAVKVIAPEARFHAPTPPLAGFVRAAAALVGVVAGLSGLYFWGLPAFAGQVAAVIPPAWEERLGESVVDELAPEKKRCHEPGCTRPVERIVETLLAAGPRTPYHYKVYVVKDNMVNAFAAPGGSIVVFTGLLEKTRSPEELAGVLAHEIQHVQKRHATKGLIRQYSLKLLISAMTGSDSGFGGLLGTAGNLGLLSYNRADEAEADREGMRLMQKARLNPQGMVSMFEMLQKEAVSLPRALAILSDHPDTGDRIAKMRVMAKEAHYKPIELLPEVSWRQVAGGCGGAGKHAARE